MTSSKPLSYNHPFVLEAHQCKLLLIQPLCRSAPGRLHGRAIGAANLANLRRTCARTRPRRIV